MTAITLTDPMQLALFSDSPPIKNEEMEHPFFIEFRDHFLLQIAKNHLFIPGTCADWWRSRYHDWLYPGHYAAKTKEEWKYKHDREIAWKEVLPFVQKFAAELCEAKIQAIKNNK